MIITVGNYSYIKVLRHILLEIMCALMRQSQGPRGHEEQKGNLLQL